MFAKFVQSVRGLFGRLRRDRKGAALVEYALLVAGVALIAAAAVSVLGHKTTDMIATVAAILPGAHTDDNNAIQSGHLIETGTVGTGGSIAVDPATILGNNGTARLNANVFGQSSELGLVVESSP
jgi:pilus assembly protein Flp/PilA